MLLYYRILFKKQVVRVRVNSEAVAPADYHHWLIAGPPSGRFEDFACTTTRRLRKSSVLAHVGGHRFATSKIATSSLWPVGFRLEGQPSFLGLRKSPVSVSTTGELHD